MVFHCEDIWPLFQVAFLHMQSLASLFGEKVPNSLIYSANYLKIDIK